MSSQNDRPPPSRLAVFGAVTFYLVAALAMIIANKWVLNKSSTPLFFLFMQLLVAVLLLFICRVLRILKFNVALSMPMVKGLAPLVLINVIGLSFNNFTLQLVDASYYQVARGLLVPFTVATSFVFLHSRPSLLVLVACGIVTAGFLVGVLLDQQYSTSTESSSPLGIICGLVSTLTTSLHAVVIKRSLDIVNGDTIELAWYSNLLRRALPNASHSALLLLPVIHLAGETPGIIDLLTLDEVAKPGEWTTWQTFLAGTAVTGVFGFLICIAGFLSIKVTSPITHMISSAVRSVFQSLLAMWLFHDIITTGRASSIGIILIGSIYYTYVKNEEAIARAKQGSSSTAMYERVPRKSDVEAGKKSTTQD
ncbi:hypothetical protein EXIGLDRAFT_667371 [Exidia glandulosa HHB12029]|uniref:Sugar phosphate transporter domain-containing protein n=1 Tax=Exidia glandulosa HHB12029 TaxID=1314781 RepID=A0A165N850_EXIGL|nr:hypothetical protein EXIGLDRAFT_667371 [Exidia glandulosa HHB12029]